MTVIRDNRFKHDSPEGQVCRPRTAEQTVLRSLSQARRRKDVVGAAVAKFKAPLLKKKETDISEGTNTKEPITDNISSNYPLFETQMAGFHNTVECMKQIGAGFQATSIEEAKHRVTQVKQTKHWDSFVLVNNVFFILAASCCWVVMCKDWDTSAGLAWPALATVAFMCWGSLATVRSWLFPAEAPAGVRGLVAWLLLKYGFFIAICITPWVVMVTLATSHSFQIDADGSALVHPNYQFTYSSQLFSFGLESLPVGAIQTYPIYHFWIRGTVLDHPMGFPASLLSGFPIIFYLLFVFFFDPLTAGLIYWLSPSALAEDYGRDAWDHSTGWFVTIAWWLVTGPILGSWYVFIRARAAHRAAAEGKSLHLNQDVEAATRSEPHGHTTDRDAPATVNTQRVSARADNAGSHEYPKISAEDLQGCWVCGCVPGFCAISHQSARGPDSFVSEGLCFPNVLCPFSEQWDRVAGTNTFEKRIDKNSRLTFESDGFVCFGLGCTCRLCKFGGEV